MPKTFLAIETSTRQMGVALLDEQGARSAYELLADYPHAVELPEAVRRVLKAGGSTLEQVEAIVVDIGPGSFTGLRIGLAFAKALAFPARKPLVGVASLDLLAAGLAFSPRLLCPILDARQGNVYAALYRAEAGAAVRQAEYWLGPVDEVLARVTEPAVFVGDGIASYRDRILARCPQPQFAAQDLWWPRAATLGRLGRDRFLAGQRDDPAKLLPLYLYPLDCSVRGPGRTTSVLPSKVVQSA
jgi:tRNA threonylcarbamoyladenosine biosynthesis protein TsaB